MSSLAVEVARLVGTMAVVAVFGFWLSRHKEELKQLSPARAWKALKGLGVFGVVKLVALSFVFIGLALFLIPISAAFLEATSGQPLSNDAEHPVAVTASFSLPLLYVFMTVLPIFEEWLCRGIVLRRLAKRNLLLGVVVSSFVFGFMHLLNSGTYILAFIPPALAGFVFAGAYLAGGLGCAVLAHSGYNVIALSLIFL